MHLCRKLYYMSNVKIIIVLRKKKHASKVILKTNFQRHDNIKNYPSSLITRLFI